MSCKNSQTTTTNTNDVLADFVETEKFGAKSIWRRRTNTSPTDPIIDWSLDSKHTADHSLHSPSRLDATDVDESTERFGANSIWRRRSVTKRTFLDKNHGFMRMIVRNQLDRSEYEKFVRSKRQSMYLTRSSSPDNNLSWLSINSGRMSAVEAIGLDQLYEIDFVEIDLPMSLFLQLTDCDDLPNEYDPHYELRMKLRSAIEREHDREKQRSATNDPNGNEINQPKELDRVLQNLSLN